MLDEQLNNRRLQSVEDIDDLVGKRNKKKSLKPFHR